MVFVLAVGAGEAGAQPKDAQYDEAKVPSYALPHPLIGADGTFIRDPETWRSVRRPELIRLFEEHVYGRAPGRPEGMTFGPPAVEGNALGGKAVRKQVRISFTGKEDGPGMDLLIYLPTGGSRPSPAFLGLNFDGNHSVRPDPGVWLPRGWVPNHFGVSNHRASEASRGGGADAWEVERLLERGYALVTAYCGDIDPDFYEDRFTNGIHPVYYKEGQVEPAEDEWGSLAAWAWGLRRVMDYLETDPDIDGARVALMGHSRLGKTALWAGAQDERFALVISNNSGCGGAALFRRRFGETVRYITYFYPHWFCANFRKYSEREDSLPVDQHLLLALIAPRPLYVAGAEQDLWADPRGEFLAARNAGPAYRLFGAEGLPVDEMPALDHPVSGTIGYHLRSGRHQVTPYDWERYLDFADKHFAAKK